MFCLSVVSFDVVFFFCCGRPLPSRLSRHFLAEPMTNKDRKTINKIIAANVVCFLFLVAVISVEHFERLRLVCFDDQWSSIIARLTAMLTLTITRGQSRILLDVVRPGIELRLKLKVRHDVVRQHRC